MAFVHHTASGNDYSRAEAPAIMRGVYAYHTRSLHWSDIGYNFLVDRYGTIYEGRYGGMTKGVIGAQVAGLQHRQYGHLGDRHVQHGCAPGCGGDGAGTSPGLEAGCAPRRPRRQGDADLRVRAEVRHRPERGVPRDRRPSRRQLHRLPRRQAVQSAAGDPEGRSPPWASPRSTRSTSPAPTSVPMATACATRPRWASPSRSRPPGAS